MLLIYYNVKTDSFYWKIVKSYLSYFSEVGSLNGYNHLLVEKFYFLRDDFLTYQEYLNAEKQKEKDLEIKRWKKKNGLKNKLINQFIDLLNRLKN